MKSPSHDNPDLTAYALGELHALQARDIHALLAKSPAATHELEQVEAVTDALRQGAPIPQERLRPEQRHAVLYPTDLPARVSPVMRPKRRTAPTMWPVFANVMKAAAVVTLTAAAYVIGRQSGIGGTSLEVAEAAKKVEVPQATIPSEVTLQPPVPKVEKVAVVPKPVIETLETVTPPVSTPTPEKAPVMVASTEPLATTPEVKKEVVPKSAPVVTLVQTTPAPKAQAAMPIITPGKHVSFVSASRRPVDQFALTPAQIRPAPSQGNKNELLAAPALAQQLTETKENTRLRTPDIYIHSWRADIASCPWDETHRLLRVTIQLPADQPAALTQTAYPLRVQFDANNVREYRQLCERHEPAQELRKAGTHVVWYEFIPNGALDKNKILATVTLDKGRFTSQTVGPFDSTKLKVQDTGISWGEAREDFVFDSAVVGFGLLMRGIPSTPELDHDLVLKLAERSKGKDANGERARFIQLVKEAAGAAGL